ncbi:Golgi-specific brefeldin A-resistance guanine nucleotide exchange factor 1 isoform X2 [Toxorhynchites rutilus septentrionalis]|uniref:Golgi-specific brefeldin A-resistance guanine nucleotide exchange factor 1 isoform X2 n=1 Tax=Toxorhynchites rutilus septentrionalis TaxID=329112 RepID=UPI0024787EB8|nr:Golgi-specific brefeldin A-resistance guanine nucleotide exchange factor 1 isoform X2 [Toxorhynchites rutilus septentrionalis]
MSPPGNGIFVVRGEMSILTTAMRRGSRWNSNSYQDDDKDGLLKNFHDLKEKLLQLEDLRLVEPAVFLGPFLEVIRSEETTGPVTSLALSAVNKFLSYGLIDPTHSTLAATVESIADAVTHARFVGTDQTSDGVVLMKIVQVLRTLLLSPEGSALSNENVCDIILSCFRLCFEPRLNELVRKTAENALKDIVLLLFMRLPQFVEGGNFNLKSLKMRSSSMDQSSKKRKVSRTDAKPTITVPKIVTSEDLSQEQTEPTTPVAINAPKALKPPPLSTTPATPAGTIVDMQGAISQTPKSSQEPKTESTIPEEADIQSQLELPLDNTQADAEETPPESFVNAVGVRFTQQTDEEVAGPTPHLPYGLPCIRELFRFLISLCNPLDKQNTDVMIHMGLTLLTVTFEVGADSIGKYDSLLTIVKDDLCKNLFALLATERISIFATDLQLCFLMFESLRSQLKFQLEYYLTKLADLIVNENPRILYEARELALDNLLQLWRIPGFAAELYINYDCDLYCTNLFEDLTKLMSKNTLSATYSIYSVHTLSTDALLTIIESIEKNCLQAKNGEKTTYMRHSRNNSSVDKIVLELGVGQPLSPKSEQGVASPQDPDGNDVVVESINKYLKSSQNEDRLRQIASQESAGDGTALSQEELAAIKKKKRLLTQGTDLFNQRPEKGIQFLQENGILNSTLDPLEVAHFLRENSGLDKKMIGEYISKKKNVESKILEVFVKSFDFAGLTIDQALRLYLETFRLPGEAPLIFLVMEHFADHWHKCNNEPFANTDAAFRLAYAIIMLNMDQHNHNAKRLNVPMTAEDFLKNLRGLNGNSDFDQDMLTNVYHSIKNEEIVMPAEQTGIVRENYLWKMLLRRGTTKDGLFHHVFGPNHDRELFRIIQGSTLAALSFIFDKSNDNAQLYQKSMNGFIKSAVIASHYNLHSDFDALVLTLCKFTTLLNPPVDVHEITTNVLFGQNAKAQLAMKTVYALIHAHGDCMREGWKHIVEVVLQLFRLKLLPKSLMEAEDFCEPGGKVALVREQNQLPKTDAGLLSSLYSYLSNDSQRQPSYEEQEIIKLSKRCIKECQIDQIVNESKFLHFESLVELVNCMLGMIKAPESHKSVGLPYAENTVVFLMELLVKILIQNRDRLLPIWKPCQDQFYLLLNGSSSCDYTYLLQRTTVAILKLAIYLMRNEEICSTILQSLRMLLMLKPTVILSISKPVSIGIYELLKTSAQNIHSEADWVIVFTILECVGAGAMPPEYDEAPVVSGTKSDGALSSEEDSGLPDRGYISDSELNTVVKSSHSSNSCTPLVSPTGDNWILVNKDADIVSSRSTSPKHTIQYHCKLLEHSPFALVKCWESLSFIVRNVAHITPYNFERCVRCIRTFVEASMNDGKQKRRRSRSGKCSRSRNRKNDSSDSESEDTPEAYESISIQLLDLMHTLHTRTAQIFRWWAEEGGALPQCSALWSQGWCPLLQGIARLATDQRRQVRTSAVTCLQRALLVQDLQTLTGLEWAGCFKQVLFPLLSELLSEKPVKPVDAGLLEESRMRTATIMSKVFLHHLTPLIALAGFNELWLEILEYFECFMKIGSDLLYEAVLESLKNMLLVMHSVCVFHNSDGVTHSVLWDLTWQRISGFLPNLKDELFRNDAVHSSKISVAAPAAPPSQNALTNTVEPPPAVQPHSNVDLLQLQPTIASPPGELERVTTGTNNLLINNTSILNPPPMISQMQTPVLVPNLINAPPPIIPATQTYSSPVPSHDGIELESSPQHNTNRYSNIIELPVTPSPPPCALEQNTVAEPEPQHPATMDPTQPVIPRSHLVAGNQYPSLHNVPIGIAQSFAPIFVQPNQGSAEGADIYTDYINDPYNLTLQFDRNASDQQQSSPPQEPQLSTQAKPQNEPFLSSNYFGTMQFGSGRIPPEVDEDQN